MKKEKEKSNKLKYKKPPQAPRRFKSSYMFFSTVKHREIRAELEKEGKMEKTTEIAKLVSIAWKKLSPEERKYYDEQARQDKARYEMEKSLYTGPWKLLAKKRTPKDPGAPKRPMSAFLSFAQSRRVSVRTANPDLDNIEVSRILAKMWKEAPDSVRRTYIEEELGLRQQYKVAIAEWRAKEDADAMNQRHQREDVAIKRMATMSSYSEERDKESAKMPAKEGSTSDAAVNAPAHSQYAALSSMYQNSGYLTGGYPNRSYYGSYSYPPYPDGGYAGAWMAQAAGVPTPHDGRQPWAYGAHQPSTTYGAQQDESAPVYRGIYGYPNEAAYQQGTIPVGAGMSYESAAAYDASAYTVAAPVAGYQNAGQYDGTQEREQQYGDWSSSYPQGGSSYPQGRSYPQGGPDYPSSFMY